MTAADKDIQRTCFTALFAAGDRALATAIAAAAILTVAVAVANDIAVCC